MIEQLRDRVNADAGLVRRGRQLAERSQAREQQRLGGLAEIALLHRQHGQRNQQGTARWLCSHDHAPEMMVPVILLLPPVQAKRCSVSSAIRAMPPTSSEMAPLTPSSQSPLNAAG